MGVVLVGLCVREDLWGVTGLVRALLDKMMQLLGLLALDAHYFFVADAYYASRKIALPLLRQLFTKGFGAAKNFAFRLLEATRNALLTPHDYRVLLDTRIQIRFHRL